MKKINAMLTALLLLCGGSRAIAQTTQTNIFSGLNSPIPDGNPAGLSDVRTISSSIVNISALRVKLRIAGEFNGDLYGYVTHSSGLCVLLNRPGRTSGNLPGYDDSGLNVTFDTTASNGDIHLYRSITTPTDGSPLTGVWQPDGRKADPGAVSDTSPRDSSLGAFNGMDASGDWTLFLADMESGGTNMLVSWELDIAGAIAPQIVWTSPADIVYGTPLGAGQLSATAVVAGTNVLGTLVYSPAAATVLNAGAGQTLSVTFTPNDPATYISVSKTVSLNVTKAPLTITAVDKTMVYGATVPALSASYGGFVNSDNSGSLTTPVSLTTTATSTSDAATYNITASGAAGANYTITFVTGHLTITQAPLTVAAADASRAYGVANPVFTGNITGTLNNDAITATYSTVATPLSPVGSYAIVPLPAGAKLGNYQVSLSNGALTVTPAALTITADNQTKLFGAPLPTFTAHYAGFANGENEAALTTPVSFNCSATPTSDAGTYPITPQSAASGNYAIAFVSGTLTIGKADTIATIASSKNPAKPGESIAFTFTPSAVAPGAGVPTGTVQFTINGANAGTAPLSSGAATFNTSLPAAGSYTVAVAYTGDGNFNGSTATLAPVQVINTPPIAGADTLERYPTNGVKVTLASLLANDSDADGDAISLVSMSGNSTHGGTVIQSGKWVFYTPAPGWTDADSFTYVITDTRGATATGTVTVNIKSDQTPSPNLIVADLGNGQYKLRFNGIPGRTYTIQFSPSVVSPNWQFLHTAAADSLGVYEYIDTPPQEAPQRYYRSTYP